MKRFLPLLLVLSACGRPDAPLRAPDPANGQRQFAACAGCHSLSPGVTVFGPSLYSVYGRKAGSLAGYDYSPSMRAYGKAWDEAALDTNLLVLRAPHPSGRWLNGHPEARDKIASVLAQALALAR